ncbi:MAG: peptidylprolyl isomerase [Proteobacteria bacterium]|nr:peptidylprolyl isomerase [Pseudomonadota bacterium]
MNKRFPALLLTASAALSSPIAVNGADKSAEPVVAATVDDVVITEELVGEYSIQRQRQAPQAPQASRDQLIDDLISSALLAREYDRLEMNKNDIESQLQMMYAKAKRVVATQVTVSNEEVEALYNQKYKSEGVKSFEGMEYHTRHILLKTEEEALAIMKKLKDGSDFAELAKQVSEDKGSGSAGGDLGWFKPQSLVAPYSEAMQALKVGEMTDSPVQSQFGWHIIELLEEPRKSPLPTLAEQDGALRNELFGMKLNSYISNLRTKAKVTINPAPAPAPAAKPAKK